MHSTRSRWLRWTLRLANTTLFVAAFVFLLWRSGINAQAPDTGSLRLTILDAERGGQTPARVEILDKEGKGYVAEDALLVGGDPKDRKAPWKGSPQEALELLDRAARNRFSGATEFYSSGRSNISLPAGEYDVTVRKGFEFRNWVRHIRILPGQDSDETVSLSRWIDMASKGWYSADSHLHIARSHAALDPLKSKWMQAEDIHVATLLSWGHSKGFNNTSQYSYGSQSVYREGDYLLASGQENPRTHMLGHLILLGAREPIDFPDQYLIYRLFHQEIHEQGGLSGYAHGGFGLGALNGLSIDLPLQLLGFVEVHTANQGYYDVWYNVLNTGFRVTPVTGTDYPFSRSFPGMERYYTRVSGPLTYESWLEGVREGRTFVTNGPMVEFRVDGRESGDQLILEEPRAVRIEGCVRFDPSRDDVELLEVINNGQVKQTIRRQPGTSSICTDFQTTITDPGWWALRASGKKLDPRGHPGSWAHSGAVYVVLQNRPPLFESDRAKALALAWAARLQELEYKLFHRIDFIGQSHGFDEVSRRYVLAHRDELLEEIRRSRKFFQEMAR